MTAKAIREKALALPVEERMSLVADLWNSIAADEKSLPLSKQHAQIIDQRIADDIDNPQHLVSWDDAVKEARRRVSRKKKR